MIQRDYAQGRQSEEEVLEDFLSALEGALKKSANDSNLPLNLDFIYGSVEGIDETRFLPLDGQQRLTTLFLLHWYLAWRDQKWDEFSLMFRTNGHSRFSYSVRPSSNEFFDALVSYKPDSQPEQVQELNKLIADQPWYFRSWRLDPTIQSALAVLDAIHCRFSSEIGLFERLTSESQPAITFQLLDLDNFGLSDDLYVKMNARGKPLTPFETFKARYVQELKKQFIGEYLSIGTGNFTVAEFVARRMDTLWADLFWIHRDKTSNLYDEAIMNVFRAVALITRNPESSTYLKDIEVLRSEFRAPSYYDFDTRGWLDREFTTTLIRLLEAWSGPGGALATKLPNNRYFNESGMFEKLVASGASLSYVDIVQFASYAIFIKEHYEDLNEQAFQEWMRVVYNLSVNTSYDRPADMQRSMGGLLKLAENLSDILIHFATSEKPVSGFNEQQVAEEKLKAEVILGHHDWRPLIDQAEGHGYFRGQIEFLLDFSGVVEAAESASVSGWDDPAYLKLQAHFSDCLQKAEAMFTISGLKNLPDFRWERALLCVGDYLLPKGRNHSFLVNSQTDQGSWKRLLRDKGQKREILGQLWKRLVGTNNLATQLDAIISGTANLEPWREAFVRTPAAISYCWRRFTRRDYEGNVYLMQASQMNGTHAELFTYCLYENTLLKLSNAGRMKPLELLPYQSQSATEVEPGISLTFLYVNNRLRFEIEFRRGQFLIYIVCNKVKPYPLIEATLLDGLGFAQDGWVFTNTYNKRSTPDLIESTILELAGKLATTPSPEQDND
jgi:hypothetical protein